MHDHAFDDDDIYIMMMMLIMLIMMTRLLKVRKLPNGNTHNTARSSAQRSRNSGKK